jgi:hypothetical protein
LSGSKSFPDSCGTFVGSGAGAGSGVGAGEGDGVGEGDGFGDGDGEDGELVATPSSERTTNTANSGSVGGSADRPAGASAGRPVIRTSTAPPSYVPDATASPKKP